MDDSADTLEPIRLLGFGWAGEHWARSTDAGAKSFLWTLQSSISLAEDQGKYTCSEKIPSQMPDAALERVKAFLIERGFSWTELLVRQGFFKPKARHLQVDWSSPSISATNQQQKEN